MTIIKFKVSESMVFNYDLHYDTIITGCKLNNIITALEILKTLGINIYVHMNEKKQHYGY